MSDTIHNFGPSVVSRFNGFYLLKKISVEDMPVSIKLQTADGLEDPNINYSLASTGDGRLVFCFDSSSHYLKYNNLVAISGSKVEIINLQIFERLHRYYKLDGRSDNKSLFFFYNSIFVTTEIDNNVFNISDRCHLDLLGPETFMKDDAPIVPLVDYRHVYVYEPVLSVNGIAHLGYAHTNLDLDWYSNSDPFPRIAMTLQESMKQICEWAAVTDSPWDNSETISTHSRDFLAALDLTESEISHLHSRQPDLQILNYIKGDTNARSRPDEAGDLTIQLENSIVSRLSHVSVKNFVTINRIDIDDAVLLECVQIQQQMLDSASSRVISCSGLDFDVITHENIDAIKNEIFKRGRAFINDAVLADVVLAVSELNA